MAKAGQKFAASVSGDCGALVSVGVDGKRAGIEPATITLLITQVVLPLVKGLIERCRARREQHVRRRNERGCAGGRRVRGGAPIGHPQ